MSSASIPHSTRPSQPLAFSFVLSLLVHAVAALALLGAWSARPVPSPTLDRSPISALQKPDPVRAGIRQSNAVTINWLGFETPTPHQAAQSSTDQAALSPVPARQAVQQKSATASMSNAAAPAPAPAPASPSTETTTTDMAALKASLLTARAKLAKIFASTKASAKARSQALAQLSTDSRSKTLAKVPAKAPTNTKSPPSEAKPPAVNPSPESQPVSATRVSSDMPSEKSEKESAATSTQKPIDWHPGHPAAAQGLDITTVSPRWSYATRLSALPRNPLVRIEFARDGHVQKAAFLPKRSTGYPDVDGPLLDAIYRWKAKGKALDDLPKTSDAAVSLTFRIVLNASRGTIKKPKSKSK